MVILPVRVKTHIRIVNSFFANVNRPSSVFSLMISEPNSSASKFFEIAGFCELDGFEDSFADEFDGIDLFHFSAKSTNRFLVPLAEAFQSVVQDIT